MGKKTGKTVKGDSARIQAAAAKNPDSKTAQDGFDRRAQSAADKHEHDEDDE
ncbi:hypothetical protein [Streptosporangium amethystogenes]|uniref:hypothetical protein n=1 Tax=Streptosporangium amethystogenes TaxID=2002 RepID=UPI0012FACB19|nr:hypothetical protein [Streptosporangium amethystogenes]